MQNLTIYNTMTMQKELFQPFVPGKVNMFVCGPTVQGYMHIGHARTYIFYDVLARYLSHIGYEVNFLMNITDIDDRITSAAKAQSLDPEKYAEGYAKAFVEDMNQLRILTVTSFERVSNYIPEMIRQISTLINKKHAYVVDGEVFFDVSSYPEYGKLSHQSPLELSLRPLEISPEKRGLLDFALWRSVSLIDGQWSSPWGVGSPGWHIQDTALSMSSFGPQYDIHGGAYDLIYPHHEAEIAQAESASGVKPFVKYWVHTRLVNLKGSKMSKSEGNVLNVRDALHEFSPDQLRLYFLSSHYRSDAEFDERKLKKIGDDYNEIKKMAKGIEENRSARARRRDSSKVLQPVYDALNDDMDTSKAVEFLIKLANDGAREKDPNQVELYYESLRAASNILGVDLFGPIR
jgi:cysteinyl-tRNA synthetase